MSDSAPQENNHKQGVLLINIGTPASPEPEDIRPYLEEFLQDKNLVSAPHFVWLPVLYGIILRRRPASSARKYRRIWTPEGSPFLLNSIKQAEKLQQLLNEEAKANNTGITYYVEAGMRYGNPSLEEKLTKLEKASCRDVIAIPLFPQTAFSTTRTSVEKMQEVAKNHPQTSVRIIKGYAENEQYLHCVANSIRSSWKYTPGSKLLFAFHSIPCKHVAQGDTYVQEIKQSMQKIADLLGIPAEDWSIGYQSRFEDSRKWVGPMVKSTLCKWASEGICRVGIVTPGFSVDCLETLWDCAIDQKHLFETVCAEHGNKADYTYIPALNASPEHIAMLAHLVTNK